MLLLEEDSSWSDSLIGREPCESSPPGEALLSFEGDFGLLSIWAWLVMLLMEFIFKMVELFIRKEFFLLVVDFRTKS